MKKPVKFFSILFEYLSSGHFTLSEAIAYAEMDLEEEEA